MAVRVPAAVVAVARVSWFDRTRRRAEKTKTPISAVVGHRVEVEVISGVASSVTTAGARRARGKAAGRGEDEPPPLLSMEPNSTGKRPRLRATPQGPPGASLSVSQTSCTAKVPIEAPSPTQVHFLTLDAASKLPLRMRRKPMSESEELAAVALHAG